MANAQPESIQSIVDRSPEVDNSQTFDRMWGILGDVFSKVENRLELIADPINDKHATFSGQGGFRGSLNGYRGPDVDWCVKTWIGRPESGFVNQQLNVWLGPNSRVPHLRLELGTVPKLFFFQDFVPRVDLWDDPAYGDTYYAPCNADFLALRGDPELNYFVSEGFYMRVTQSPAHGMFSGEVNEEVIGKLEAHIHRQVDRWLGWLDAAEAVPADEQQALHERDRRIRHNLASRGTENEMAEKMLGAQLAHELIQGLWGLHGQQAGGGERG
jgi:hypothetical protein